MDKKNFSVDDQKFLSDTEYSASVRSSPDQASYMGQWSSWSSELHWRTKPSLNGEIHPHFLSILADVEAPLTF